MSTWISDQEQLKLFRNGAAAIMKSAKIMRSNAPTEDPVFNQAMREFSPKMDLFENAEQAIIGFQVWLKNWRGWTPSITKCSFTKISVNFVVPFGKAYVEFSAEGSPLRAEDMSLSDLEAAYRELWEMCSAAAQEFWRQAPRMAFAAGANAIDPAMTEDKVEVVEVTHILREDKVAPGSTEMKAYYKLIGGKYSQFGVVVYPEVLEASGIKLDRVKPGKHGVSKGARMWVSLNNEDKPVKVVRVERGN